MKWGGSDAGRRFDGCLGFGVVSLRGTFRAVRRIRTQSRAPPAPSDHSTALTSAKKCAFEPMTSLWQSRGMTTVFHTTAEELDESFIASVKAAFKGRAIEIAVTEDDETGYLLRHPANRARLLRAVADVEAGRNVVTPDQTPFQ
jgi:antitoxin YefM